MSNPNYMTQGSNGIVNIDCNSMPDKGFLDAVKTKNIVKFRIMSHKDKAANADYVPGGPDVIVKHITGETQLITRKDLVKTYVHASGNKIKLSVLKSDKPYLAYNTCNENYKVMKLPNNCIATLPNGTQTKPGNYIVAKVDVNGQVDKSSLAMISPSVFKKMFKIPLQAVIKRHMGSDSKTRKMFTLFSRNQDRQFAHKQIQPESVKPTFNSSEIGMNPANINISSVNDSPEKKVWRPTINRQGSSNQQTANTNIKSTYKYRVTAKVVDMDGRMLGFAVQEIATGRSRNLKINELTQLCMNKLVENVMVVHNQRGNIYLKGNGCSLESLPQVIA